MTTRYYTLGDITDVTKKSRMSLYRAIKAGELPAVKVGNEWRVAESDFQTYINGGVLPEHTMFEDLLYRVSAARPRLTSAERMSLMCALASDDDLKLIAQSL